MQTRIFWRFLLPAAKALVLLSLPIFSCGRKSRCGEKRIAIALLTLLALTSPAASQPIPPLTPGFSEPMTRNGTSGGPNETNDCGYISVQPNHVVQVQNTIPYLSVQVETTGGTPTLLVEGPHGRFCLLPHDTGEAIKFAGHGDRGTYNIYVGDRQQDQHPYTLTITQTR